MNSSEQKDLFNSKKQRKNREEKIAKEGFVNTTLQQFLDWFSTSNFEKGCHYCGTTNEISNKLYNVQIENLRYNATRGGKRGRRLELDRIDASHSYDKLDNLVWCCYWCNNAKSNFFTKEEFMPIAKEIGGSISRIYHELLK